MEITLSGDISQRTAVKAAKRLLRVGQPLAVTQRFGQTDAQERNSGRVRKFRRYHSLPDATAPLAEGVTPAGHKLTYTDVQVTLQQYGDVLALTDVIQDTHEDPILKVMMDRAGEQMAKTIEVVTISHLKGGSNVYYGGTGTTRGTVNGVITRPLLRKVVRGFDRAYASPISKIIAPSEKESTSGVEPAFFAMGHTDLEPDVRSITGFKSVVEYSNPAQALPGEVGAVERIRFILTPNFTSWESTGASSSTYLAAGVAPSGSVACDVYPLLIVARDAYGIVPLQGMDAVKVYVLNPDKPDKSDPGAQRGYVTTKYWYGALILNESWLARVEVACTANPT